MGISLFSAEGVRTTELLNEKYQQYFLPDPPEEVRLRPLNLGRKQIHFPKQCIISNTYQTIDNPENKVILGVTFHSHVARKGERRDVYRVLVRKHEGKRSFGRPMCRWEDNIKMDLQEVR